jgi:hypothetical protein
MENIKLDLKDCILLKTKAVKSPLEPANKNSLK